MKYCGKTRNKSHNKSHNKSRSKSRSKPMKGGVKIKEYVAILLGLCSGVESAHMMAVCAGNTCRSPVAEASLRASLPVSTIISSRGTSVRTPGSPMAPFSKLAALSLCMGDAECIDKTNSHESTLFKCEEIKDILKSGETVQIIPMDDSVSTSISGILSKCHFTHNETSRLHVGLDCEKGICKEKSAKIKDPYDAQGTSEEATAYTDMIGEVSRIMKQEAALPCHALSTSTSKRSGKYNQQTRRQGKTTRK